MSVWETHLPLSFIALREKILLFSCYNAIIGSHDRVSSPREFSSCRDSISAIAMPGATNDATLPFCMAASEFSDITDNVRNGTREASFTSSLIHPDAFSQPFYYLLLMLLWSHRGNESLSLFFVFHSYDHSHPKKWQEGKKNFKQLYLLQLVNILIFNIIHLYIYISFSLSTLYFFLLTRLCEKERKREKERRL